VFLKINVGLQRVPSSSQLNSLAKLRRENRIAQLFHNYLISFHFVKTFIIYNE